MIGPESRFFVILLGALMMVNVLSIDMTLPALPALGDSLGASPDAVQLTLSLYLVGYALGQFVCGPFSDRFGRRPVLLTGLAVYALATVACALSRRIDVLVAARVVQGVAACGGPVIVRAIVRDHYRRLARRADAVLAHHRVRGRAAPGADRRRRDPRPFRLADDLRRHRALRARTPRGGLGRRSPNRCASAISTRSSSRALPPTTARS